MDNLVALVGDPLLVGSNSNLLDHESGHRVNHPESTETIAEGLDREREKEEVQKFKAQEETVKVGTQSSLIFHRG